MSVLVDSARASSAVRAPTVLSVIVALLPASACGGRSDGSAAVPRLAEAVRIDAELAARIEEAAAGAARGERAAWIELAALYDANQLWGPAADAYRGVPGAGDDAVVSYHLGRVLAANGDAPAALRAFDRSLELEAGYAPTHWRRGDLLQELDRLEQAEAAYRGAIRLEPHGAQGPLGLARVHLARNEPAEAVRVLEPLVERDPRVQLANGLLARAYRQLGKKNRADRALQREERADAAALSDPWTAEVMQRAVGLRVSVDRASAALRAGDARTARLVLEPLHATHPEEMAVVDLLARSFLLEERYAEALAVLDRARVVDDDHFRLELTRGRALAGAGKPAEGLVHLEKCVRDNPRFGEGWTRLGEVQLQLERHEEAERSFRHAIVEGQDTMRDWALLGRASLLRGDHQGAIATLRNGLEEYPGSPTLWANLADAWARAGNAREAEAALEKVLERDPANELIAPVRARIAELSSGGG